MAIQSAQALADRIASDPELQEKLKQNPVATIQELPSEEVSVAANSVDPARAV